MKAKEFVVAGKGMPVGRRAIALHFYFRYPVHKLGLHALRIPINMSFWNKTCRFAFLHLV